MKKFNIITFAILLLFCSCGGSKAILSNLEISKDMIISSEKILVEDSIKFTNINGTLKLYCSKIKNKQAKKTIVIIGKNKESKNRLIIVYNKKFKLNFTTINDVEVEIINSNN